MENNFDAAYKDAFELAKRQLLERDSAQVCAYSGARTVDQSPNFRIELLYLNSPVFLDLTACTFSAGNETAVHMWDQILLLHYLVNSKPQLPATQQISFKELKSAALYFQLFENRCLKPLVKAFGNKPEQLLDTVQALGGQSLRAGDAAVQLQVLPKISVSCVIWKADDEFPASASMLFDSNIEQYLPAEVIVVLCQRMVLKLLKKW